MTRPTAQQRGYGSAWIRARAGFLRSHPWCAWCADEGRQVRAQHVHHSKPHRGDQAVFWNKALWIGLCESHHVKDGQQQDNRGYRTAVDDTGSPIDPNHPWNS